MESLGQIKANIKQLREKYETLERDQNMKSGCEVGCSSILFADRFEELAWLIREEEQKLWNYYDKSASVHILIPVLGNPNLKEYVFDNEKEAIKLSRQFTYVSCGAFEPILKLRCYNEQDTLKVSQVIKQHNGYFYLLFPLDKAIPLDYGLKALVKFKEIEVNDKNEKFKVPTTFYFSIEGKILDSPYKENLVP